MPLLDQTIGQPLRATLLILRGVVACVLLIACANLANLLLARGAGRQKEIALRLAVGASRRRVVRQLLTESLLLALGGGIVGVIGAMWALRLFVAIAATRIPWLQDVRIDFASLAFTLGVCMITGLFFGLVPAWQISKPDLNSTLKEANRSGNALLQKSRLRPLLVILEVALSLVLLIGAGLMTRSFVSRLQINRGFQPQHLLTAQHSRRADSAGRGASGLLHPRVAGGEG